MKQRIKTGAHRARALFNNLTSVWPVLLGLLPSCLPEPLEVKNIPEVTPQIVVNTQIIPDEGLVVFLTRTFGALDASDNSDAQEVLDMIAVNDATVVVEGPTGIDTLRLLTSGFYGGIDIELIENETYRLYVRSESLGEVQATTTVKPQILFESVEVDRYFNGFDDSLAQVTYIINDPEEKNYYMINVQHVSFEKPLEENVLNPVGGYTRLVNDEEFSGPQIGDTFRAIPRDYTEGDTVAVLLSNISEAYYRFIELRLDNRYSFVEFISEPVNYPSNVAGGRGYFNLYIPDVRFFILE